MLHPTLPESPSSWLGSSKSARDKGWLESLAHFQMQFSRYPCGMIGHAGTCLGTAASHPRSLTGY